MQEYGKINSALRKNKNLVNIAELAKVNGKSEYKTRKDLLNYLFIEIDNVNCYAKTSKYKYIYRGFKCLDNINSQRDKEQVLNGLNKLKKLCNKKINDNVDNDNFVYKKILDIIQIALLNMAVDNNCNDKKAELLNYVVYELKNINYVFELIRTYPHYIFVKNENGYVLEKIIDDYINLAKNGEYSFDLIYLEKIIKIFVNHKDFDNNIQLKLNILNKIKEEITGNNKTTFFLNELVHDINKSNIIAKTAEDIAYKYNVNINNHLELCEYDGLCDCEKDSLVDLRNFPTITIDGKNTAVYDDAVTFIKKDDGTIILIVLVADVASYIPKDSLIDSMAYQKCETLYLPQQTIKMLPNTLTENLTLKENHDRTAIGHFFTIKDNKITNFNVERCLINVDKNYTYEEVITSLNSSDNVKELEFLTVLADLGVMLHENSGNRLEYRALKKYKKDVNGIETYDASISTLMIMEFMTLTNNYIANFFAEHPEIPFIFRANTSYGNDVYKKLQSLSIEDLNNLNKHLDTVSFYTPNNLGHKGLSVDCYCHSTNPLRNYASLECQRIIIDSFVKGILPDDYEKRYEEIKNLCEYMNLRLDANKAFKEEFVAHRKNLNLIKN